MSELDLPFIELANRLEEFFFMLTGDACNKMQLNAARDRATQAARVRYGEAAASAMEQLFFCFWYGTDSDELIRQNMGKPGYVDLYDKDKLARLKADLVVGQFSESEEEGEMAKRYPPKGIYAKFPLRSLTREELMAAAKDLEPFARFSRELGWEDRDEFLAFMRRKFGTKMISNVTWLADMFWIRGALTTSFMIRDHANLRHWVDPAYRLKFNQTLSRYRVERAMEESQGDPFEAVAEKIDEFYFDHIHSDEDYSIADASKRVKILADRLSADPAYGPEKAEAFEELVLLGMENFINVVAQELRRIAKEPGVAYWLVTENWDRVKAYLALNESEKPIDYLDLAIAIENFYFSVVALYGATSDRLEELWNRLRDDPQYKEFAGAFYSILIFARLNTTEEIARYVEHNMADCVGIDHWLKKENWSRLKAYLALSESKARRLIDEMAQEEKDRTPTPEDLPYEVLDNTLLWCATKLIRTLGLLHDQAQAKLIAQAADEDFGPGVGEDLQRMRLNTVAISNDWTCDRVLTYYLMRSPFVAVYKRKDFITRLRAKTELMS